MKSYVSFILVLTVLLTQNLAQAERVEVNRVLFSADKKTYTTRDLKIYQKVLSAVYKRKRISSYSQDSLNDFILSRLAEREAASFDLSYEKAKIPDSQKGKMGFANSEIESEIEVVAKSISLIEIKESNHKDYKRFNSWYDLMKRKYLVKLKTTDFKDL